MAKSPTGGTKELESSTPWNAIATANISTPIWSPVAAGPVGDLRERAAELAFQASDLGAVADTIEPFQHQRHFLLYCRTCSIGVCANAMGRPSASVMISAASDIVRTAPARSISRR